MIVLNMIGIPVCGYADFLPQSLVKLDRYLA